MQVGLKIDEIEACTVYTYCVYNNILFFLDISRFLDVANTSSMPRVLVFFYRTILSCLEAEKCVKFNFTM